MSNSQNSGGEPSVDARTTLLLQQGKANDVLQNVVRTLAAKSTMLGTGSKAASVAAPEPVRNHRPFHVGAKIVFTRNLDFRANSRTSIWRSADGLYRYVRIATQVLGLVAICAMGQFAGQWLQLPIPGYLVGMAILFVLLATGAVELRWIEEGASLLLRHLSFFFIPIAVGLMAFGSLLQAHGFAILVSLVVSAVVGIVATGIVTQFLARKDRQP